MTKKSWLNKRVFLLLTGLFFITELFGLFIANKLITLGVSSSPFVGDMNNPLNAIYLITTILIMTGIILIVLKFKKQKHSLLFIELLALFATSTIVFGALYPKHDFLVYLATGIIIILRLAKREDKWIKNLASVIAIVGAGSLIGISFGLLVIIPFIIALSLYDIIAVFFTKHMVAIGKEVTKRNFAFTLSMPTKKHTFELGNGDLVIPLITASSIIANGFFTNNLLVALLVLIGSFFGICTSIYSVSKKKIPLPALPPQTVIMIIIIIISFLIGL